MQIMHRMRAQPTTGTVMSRSEEIGFGCDLEAGRTTPSAQGCGVRRSGQGTRRPPARQPDSDRAREVGGAHTEGWHLGAHSSLVR
jgi:hypothetical protein